MSGGVDSSVAAALLVQQGHEVVGVFMRLGSPGEPLEELIPGGECTLKIGKQGCCSVGDAEDARHVAGALDIPFYVVNFKREFSRIIDHFVAEYDAGRTPNPCVRCNDWLKFGRLHEYAHQIGASRVASGHYAAIEDGPDGPRLLRGLDQGKDQSYVLFGTPRDRLNEMLLPIGGMHKSDVRAMAKKLGLPVFDKPDSQEICFVPDNDYAGLVSRNSTTGVKPGRFWILRGIRSVNIPDISISPSGSAARWESHWDIRSSLSRRMPTAMRSWSGHVKRCNREDVGPGKATGSSTRQFNGSPARREFATTASRFQRKSVPAGPIGSRSASRNHRMPWLRGRRWSAIRIEWYSAVAGSMLRYPNPANSPASPHRAGLCRPPRSPA